MSAHPGLALAVPILALALLLPPAARAAEEEAALPVLESGEVTLALDGSRVAIGYAQTVVGPLFTLQPLVARLGGELEIGPLGQSHRLRLDEGDYWFGPGSGALTRDQEIMPLSQPPQVGASGLLVPLDLLERTYGGAIGYVFSWRPRTRELSAEQRPPREVAVAIDAVHLQGVSTVVLRFSERPRYQLRRTSRGIEVEITGDRLRFSRRPSLPAGGLVRDLELAPQRVRLALSSDAVAEDYTLTRPFRIVFDVYRGAVARAPALAPRPQRRSGRGVRTIVIDPGHGGSDTGAKGPTGILEKDLTLQLARTLKARLERSMAVTVVLTRGEDAELPLDTRTAVANQQKADLFISLHLNSAPVRNAHGAETYFLSLVPSDERAAMAAAAENIGSETLSDLQLILWDLAQSHHMAESQRLASLIQEELNQALDVRNRGVKQAPFAVLMGAAMPAVLVELGFLNNPREEEKLRDPSYRARLADALVDAVSRYRASLSGVEPATKESLR